MVEICAGDTPLHDAATWSKKNFVELLVRHGAVVDAKNENGLGLLGTWKSDEKWQSTKPGLDFLLRGIPENRRDSVGSSYSLISPRV